MPFIPDNVVFLIICIYLPREPRRLNEHDAFATDAAYRAFFEVLRRCHHLGGLEMRGRGHKKRFQSKQRISSWQRIALPILFGLFIAFFMAASASGTGVVMLVSANEKGEPADAIANLASISADGRFVAFKSSDNNMLPGDTDIENRRSQAEDYVKDTVTGKLFRVSTDSNGTRAIGWSEMPNISPDGEYVVFSSPAPNLVAGDTNGVIDVFVKKIPKVGNWGKPGPAGAGQTIRVSTDSSGKEGNYRSFDPFISGVHTDSENKKHIYVVFQSEATNLVGTVPTQTQQAYVKEINIDDNGTLTNGRTLMVSTDSNGRPAMNPDIPELEEGAATAFISNDGSLVSFLGSPDLIPRDPDEECATPCPNVYVKDVIWDNPGYSTGSIMRASSDSAGTPSMGGGSGPGFISANNNYVAFFSDATNLLGRDGSGNLIDSNGFRDVFRKEIKRDQDGKLIDTGEIIRVSTAADGTQANDASQSVIFPAQGTGLPYMSQDGRMITFASKATNLLDDPAQSYPKCKDTIGGAASISEYNCFQIYVKTIELGQTNGPVTIVSIDSGGNKGNGNSHWAPISANGLLVAFSSSATNFMDGYPGIYLATTSPDVTPPTIPTINPENGSIIYSRSVTLSANYADPAYSQGINVFSITVILDGEILDNNKCSASGSPTGTVSCPDMHLESGPHRVSFYVPDNAGHTALASSSFIVSPLAPGLTARLSTNSSWAEANDSSHSYLPVISADNKFTVFASFATNLRQPNPDYNKGWDIFKKDNRSGDITLVNATVAGDNTNFGSTSTHPSVSYDGTFVAFKSDARNLVDREGTNTLVDVFVKDTSTGQPNSGQIIKMSTDSNGDSANLASDWPAISADGKHVAFSSSATNLIPSQCNPAIGDVYGDCNAVSDIFVKEIDIDPVTGKISGGQTIRISTRSDSGEANLSSSNPAISADGKYVVFLSNATNLVPGMEANLNSQVYVKKIKDDSGNLVSNGPTTCLSCPPGGGYGDGGSGWPAISNDDGSGNHWVTYPSYASNLVPGDNNGERDIFRANVETGQITRVSTDSNGSQVTGYSAVPQISANGRYVAFYSEAANLIPSQCNPDLGSVHGDCNAVGDIFVKDASTGQPTSGQTIRISTATNGSEANGRSDYPFIVTGVWPYTAPFYVAFTSDATNLVDTDGDGEYDDDRNGVGDVFLASKS